MCTDIQRVRINLFIGDDLRETSEMFDFLNHNSYHKIAEIGEPFEFQNRNIKIESCLNLIKKINKIPSISSIVYLQ